MTKWGTLLRVNDQNSVTIQHVNETRSSHNFVGDWWKHGHKSERGYKHFYIGCLKTQKQQLHFVNKNKIKNLKNYFKYIFVLNNSGRALDNRAECKAVRAGCSTLINMPSWNTTSKENTMCFVVRTSAKVAIQINPVKFNNVTIQISCSLHVSGLNYVISYFGFTH